jgi:hypothetical protein
MAYNSRQEKTMADTIEAAGVDPYAGIETDEERQAVYERLLEQNRQDEATYRRELAEYERAEYARKKSVYDALAGDLKAYRKVQLHEDGQFCKYMAMFAAGSFGVSFAFIDKIVSFETAAYKGVIVAAWACLAIALIINVAIHFASSIIHRGYHNMVLDNIQRGYEGRPPLPYRRWYSGWVMAVLYAMDFVSFIGGMTCLVLFVFLNI